MLSEFVIAFLLRSKCLLISWLWWPPAVILEPKKRKSVSAFTSSPSSRHEVMAPDAMTFIFQMLSFKPAFSLSSFILIQQLFSFSLLSAIKLISSAYLRLLIFLPEILIPACDSSIQPGILHDLLCTEVNWARWQYRGEEPRWCRNRTGRPRSLLQIHQKNNRTQSKLHKTTSDR